MVALIKATVLVGTTVLKAAKEMGQTMLVHLQEDQQGAQRCNQYTQQEWFQLAKSMVIVTAACWHSLTSYKK